MPPPASALVVQSVVFSGTNVYLQGTAPVSIQPSVTILGQPPFFGSFSWGDGSAPSTQMNQSSPAVFAMTHSYAAGNWTLTMNFTDGVGTHRTMTFPIASFVGGYSGTAGISAIIEGYAKVSRLFRQTFQAQPIVAYIKNTGTKLITQLTVQWYRSTWGTLLKTDYQNATVIPGGMYALSDWDGFQPTVVTTPGNYSYWVRVTSASAPGLNATSPNMTVQYTTDAWLPQIAATYLSSNPLSVAISQLTPFSVRITNTGYFTESWTEAEGVTGAPQATNFGYVFPFQSSFGVILNGSQQWAQIPFLTNPTPLANRIYLMPGESILLDSEEFAQLGTGGITPAGTDTIGFTPKTVLGSVPWTGPEAFMPFQVTSLSQDATIQTSYVVPLGNGTVKFGGTVVSMLASVPQLKVDFVFWQTNATPIHTFATDSQTVTSAPQVVTFTVTGLAAGVNYTVYFEAFTPSNAHIVGNTLQFVVPGGVGGGSGPNPAGNFVEGFLTQIGLSAGVPPELIGGLIGLALLVTVVVFFTILDVDEIIIALAVVAVALVNAWLLFWPSFTVLIIALIGGLMVWDRFTEGGATSG